jgi:hypothetical protein
VSELDRRLGSSPLDTRLANGPLEVRSVWTPEAPERVARRVLRKRRIKLGVTAGAGACALALLPLVFTKPFVTERSAGAAQLAVSPPAVNAPIAVAAASPTVLQGSTAGSFAGDALAELSGDDARLVIEDESPERVVARLSGKGRFRVLPRPGRSVEIRTAELRMHVLGSSFMVEELPEGRAHVAVERGLVEVSWIGGGTVLQGGQSGTFPPTAVAERAPKRSERPDPAGELMAAADAARLGGEPGRAVAPLKRVVERHRRDRRAPLAAFSLGRVLLDDLHRPGQAAAAFQKARKLWPSGPLAQDALAREAEARAAAGQAGRAAELAAQYLAREPGGRHAEAMRALTR